MARRYDSAPTILARRHTTLLSVQESSQMVAQRPQLQWCSMGHMATVNQSELRLLTLCFCLVISGTTAKVVTFNLGHWFESHRGQKIFFLRVGSFISAQKVSSEMFMQHFNLPHFNHYIFSLLTRHKIEELFAGFLRIFFLSDSRTFYIFVSTFSNISKCFHS